MVEELARDLVLGDCYNFSTVAKEGSGQVRYKREIWEVYGSCYAEYAEEL